MWLIVSSLSPQNLHLLFCCVLSLFALMLLVFIALYCAAIKYFVSSVMFPFLSHVQNSLCGSIYFMYSYCCFSSHLCFLVIFVLSILVLPVLFLVAVISLPVHFFVKSSSDCIDALILFWILTSCHLSSFLNKYCLSTSSLGGNALYIVMCFLSFWSIYRSSSLIHFKNCPEYLTRKTVEAFLSLMRFLLLLWFPVVSSFSWYALFYFFFHLHLFDGVSFHRSHVFLFPIFCATVW